MSSKLIKVVPALAILAIAGHSCCTTRYVERERVVYKDSLVHKIEYRDSLIHVPIPLEKNQVITTLGDTSKLETSIARSTAFVDENGLLHHSLENKSDKTLPFVVPIKSEFLFNGISHMSSHAVEKTVEVEKPLSWWRSLKIRAFWWLVLACVIGFRRELLALIRKIV